MNSNLDLHMIKFTSVTFTHYHHVHWLQLTSKNISMYKVQVANHSVISAIQWDDSLWKKNHLSQNGWAGDLELTQIGRTGIWHLCGKISYCDVNCAYFSLFFIANSSSGVSRLFSEKDQIVNNSGYAGFIVSVTTTQLWHRLAKADTDDV